MKRRLFTLLAIASLPAVTLLAAPPPVRVLLPERNYVLGAKLPKFMKLNLAASAGETVTITIGEGDDNSGDQGLTWRLEDPNGNILGKGFTKEIKKVSWKVALKSSNPVLIIEDKDTASKGDRPGNGFNLSVTATKTAPAPAKPAPGKYDNYFGGPKAWYNSGFELGKADRKAGKKPDVNRHKDHYDEITAGEFRRGYLEGYH